MLQTEAPPEGPLAAAVGAVRRRLFLAPLLLLPALFATARSPARALALFTRHEVTVHFATTQGMPMANAAVRVFAPGNAKEPILTGRTDAEGKFTFFVDKSGLWSAEAAGGGEIARVMVRVGVNEKEQGYFAPRFVLSGVVALLLAVLGFRFLYWRRRP